MTTKRSAAVIDTLRALRALMRTTVLFRLGGRRTVARATRSAMAVTPTATDSLPTGGAAIWRAHRAVRRAKRLWPTEVVCLQTALVLHEVLAHRGIATAVRLGVRMSEGDVAAHAWLEVGGWVLDDTPGHEAFSPLHREPLPQRPVTA